MSVEQYGARLLSEVQEESLDKVSLLEIIPLHSSTLAALRPTTTTTIKKLIEMDQSFSEN